MRGLRISLLPRLSQVVTLRASPTNHLTGMVFLERPPFTFLLNNRTRRYLHEKMQKRRPISLLASLSVSEVLIRFGAFPDNCCGIPACFRTRLSAWTNVLKSSRNQTLYCLSNPGRSVSASTALSPGLRADSATGIFCSRSRGAARNFRSQRYQQPPLGCSDRGDSTDAPHASPRHG